MGLILGFGETENRLEEKIEEQVRSHIAERYSARDACYFEPSFVDEVRGWLDDLAKDSRDAGERYKKAADFPNRYSYFWVTVIADASHIVFILKFHHINRRHVFSPDGWACFTSERLFYVDEWDAGRAKRDAA